MNAAELTTPQAFDPSVAHSARVYNVWLDGKDNFAPDREVAARVVKYRPQVVAAARANRQFMTRAVRYLARYHGVRQFIDIGTGLPAPGSVHEVAQQVDVWSRVVYVDNDPVVLSHARALRTSTPEGSCAYLESDLRNTDYILREAARTMDFKLPVAVLLLAVLHFVPNADDPARIVGRLVSTLAPLSCIVISHLTGDFAPEAVGHGVDAYNRMVPIPVVARTHAQVTGLFGRLTLVAPGVVPVTEWRPDLRPGEARQAVDLYGGIGRKPARHW